MICPRSWTFSLIERAETLGDPTWSDREVVVEAMRLHAPCNGEHLEPRRRDKGCGSEKEKRPPRAAVVHASTTDRALLIYADSIWFDCELAGAARRAASFACCNWALSMLRCVLLARRRRRTPAGVHCVAVKTPAQSAQSQKNLCGNERIGNPPFSISGNESANVSSSRRYSEPSRR